MTDDLHALARRLAKRGDQPMELFPEPERSTPPGRRGGDLRTTAQRRRDRQAEAVKVGQHPLAVALQIPLALHPDARRDTYRDDGSPRCGSCVHRQKIGHHDSSYPKCVVADGSRVTHGPGTDVSAWWPGCVDWEAAE